MIRYYWYVTVDPKSDNYSTYDINEGVMKRSINPPPNGSFYILEIVDGYNHTTKEKDNLHAPAKYNDMGKPREIHDIAERIKLRLKEQWAIDNRKYLNEQKQTTYLNNNDIFTTRFNQDEGYQALMATARKKRSNAIKKVKRRGNITKKLIKGTRKVKK